MTDDGKLQIVRLYEIDTAPTGEGTHFECNDGSVWHPTRPFERVDGERRDDVIYPYPKCRKQ